jgi:hypothetical protein
VKFILVPDFLIETNRGVQLQEVAEHDLFLHENGVMLNVNAEATIQEFDNQLGEPKLVLVVDETIVEHTLRLVHPELSHGLRVLNGD